MFGSLFFPLPIKSIPRRGGKQNKSYLWLMITVSPYILTKTLYVVQRPEARAEALPEAQIWQEELTVPSRQWRWWIGWCCGVPLPDRTDSRRQQVSCLAVGCEWAFCESEIVLDFQHKHLDDETTFMSVCGRYGINSDQTLGRRYICPIRWVSARLWTKNVKVQWNDYIGLKTAESQEARSLCSVIHSRWLHSVRVITLHNLSACHFHRFTFIQKYGKNC